MDRELEKVSAVKHYNNLCFTQNCPGVEMCVLGDKLGGPGCKLPTYWAAASNTFTPRVKDGVGGQVLDGGPDGDAVPRVGVGNEKVEINLGGQ